jgi:hypothetical protein
MLQALIGPATKLLGKFIEDKDVKNKLAHEIATMAEKHAQELAKGQLEINKTEAQHRSIFVAGWRPFVELPKLPTFDMESLLTVLMGMLGLGGLRTFEKFKGITK